jgi:hypothetical protein
VCALLLLLQTGLHLDPNNQQMQAALNDALSAKNRPPSGGGLFGPEALMRLAMDPRTRDFMSDQVGVAAWRGRGSAAGLQQQERRGTLSGCSVGGALPLPQLSAAACAAALCLSCVVWRAQEFQTMLRGVTTNPQMIGAYLNDPRMQLVRPGLSCAARARVGLTGPLVVCSIVLLCPSALQAPTPID